MKNCTKCGQLTMVDTDINGICRVCTSGRQCPYCESSRGYYYDRTIKYRMFKYFTGIIQDNQEIEVDYENTTKRCIKCDESITSYVKSLRID